MEVALLIGFFALLFLGIGGSLKAFTIYVCLVRRAQQAGKSWVKTLPRVGLPLFAGNLLTHLALGSDHLLQEMGVWYLLLNVASVLLIGITAVHLTVCKLKHSRTDVFTYSFLALAFSTIAGSIALACI